MSDTPSVAVALAAVMNEVDHVSKDGTYDDKRGTRYSFRGVDDTVNAVAPAFRKHGVLCLPNVEDVQYTSYTTRNGASMMRCTVRTRYDFVGPAGDKLSATVCGEAADSSDKATAKAQSVALRVALLQALCLPTDDPDPDDTRPEAPPPRRAATPAPPPSEGVQAFTAAANALDGPHRAELRAQLIAANLPLKAEEMTSGQRAEALIILNSLAAGVTA